MAFEKHVLNIVNPLLSGGKAYFYGGTLLLECVNDRDGMQVFRALDGADLGHISFNIHNRINGFAINFV